MEVMGRSGKVIASASGTLLQPPGAILGPRPLLPGDNCAERMPCWQHTQSKPVMLCAAYGQLFAVESSTVWHGMVLGSCQTSPDVRHEVLQGRITSKIWTYGKSKLEH